MNLGLLSEHCLDSPYTLYATTEVASVCKKFVESEGNPSEDAVLLWLNGRPSCSSIVGYLTELGTYMKHSIERPGLHSAFLPCIDTAQTETYMNNPQVRTALHIPNSLAQRWTSCNPALAANYTNQYLSMRSQFVALLPNYRVPVFNGDAGNVCNFLASQKFAASLTQPVVGERRPWRYEGQVAGFVKEYKQLTFMTVKNSGHMVPMYTPGPALQMITNFLKDKPQ